MLINCAGWLPSACAQPISIPGLATVVTVYNIAPQVSSLVVAFSIIFVPHQPRISFIVSKLLVENPAIFGCITNSSGCMFEALKRVHVRANWMYGNFSHLCLLICRCDTILDMSVLFCL